ncbi:plasmid replication protein RepC [Methylocystis parvus]|uniref:Replication initiation protein RepC n=1 Tax=Methylocystis parvus TaxID=134 RepID=A0A6B8ME54_9HYPH|nr:plasmid replication protein RepC [Methylocystis parvus]QGN00023.1 replication initiation protein RepC [Methylocystis parvus]WBK02481.1 replication initiation protein RepC [Methylocystis parvus OBBP]
MQRQTTTPFGRRSLSLAMVANQAATKEFASRPDASETVVHKWRLFRALTEAKAPLGVTDRALSVLHALLSFHQETALTLPEKDVKASESGSDTGIIVFPSNRELSIRAHGMAPATLRRHLASLVDTGLIIRRDSPNGKRFARRGEGGEIEDAFGFDLTPLIARASEIENLAEEVRAENRAVALLREKVTLMRRDIAKMIEAGMEEGVPGDWEACDGDYQALSGRLARKMTRADLEALAQELGTLASEINNSLETHVKRQNMSGNESQTERHIQNQTTNISDLEPSLQEGRVEPPGPTGEEAKADRAADWEVGELDPKVAHRSPLTPRPYPLGMVLQACPDIVDYGKGGEISCWRDLVDAAAIVRSALGISPDAWRQALEVMGEHDASIVIAAILQRGDEIKSAGGYLRVLTAKAREGEFSLGPVLMALLRGKAAKAARERKRAG